MKGLKRVAVRPVDKIEFTRNPNVVLVHFTGGKKARIRQDMMERWPGKICYPEWLDKKIFAEEKGGRGSCVN